MRQGPEQERLGGRVEGVGKRIRRVTVSYWGQWWGAVGPRDKRRNSGALRRRMKAESQEVVMPTRGHTGECRCRQTGARVRSRMGGRFSDKSREQKAE